MAFFGKSEKELKEWEEGLNKKSNSLDIKESSLANKEEESYSKKNKKCMDRESLILNRELDAKNGFSNQQKEIFEQINLQLDTLKNEQISVVQEQSKMTQLRKELLDREKEVKEKEIEAQNGFLSINEKAFKQLQTRENDIKELENAYMERENHYQEKLKEHNKNIQLLNAREEKLKEAEIERDNGFAKDQEEQLSKISKERKKFFDDFQILEEKKYKELDAELEQEQTNRENELQLKLKSQEDDLKQRVDHINEKEISYEKENDELNFQKERLKSKAEQLDDRENNLNQEVDIKIVERKKSFDSDKEILKQENDRLREEILNTTSLLNIYDELKRKLNGEEPEKILLKLNTNIETIKELRKELLERPTREMNETVDSLNSEKSRLEETCSRLLDENTTLKKDASEQNTLLMQIEDLQIENKSYKDRIEFIDADNNRLNKDLKRLTISYQGEEEREKRLKDIQLPYFENFLERSVAEVNELEWLKNIGVACENYGLKFPKRILYAFHTALKTSEWSPLTVLAGVSGTGKSELPRLYSHFGGINFLSLSVQPNWDSQESMLGFFNSIDNKFDAQPVLRLLSQSQQSKTDTYPGLEDTMSIVLLDEMNLAYVELYFAEFLSKLELRRGKKGNDVPSLNIKLGAGIEPYQLPLGRNVLWAGTMNQDETTKSLSDKVLDRGMVLHFPRPKVFERRKELKPLADPTPLLNRKIWESWWMKKSNFSDTQIKDYKEFVESINDYLSTVGKALGHRVWQSIEYYMANYPEVQQAIKDSDDVKLHKLLKIAFEDQLVLKVMPKLRGIETRGKSRTECLDKIKQLLEDNKYSIVDDFNTACETGYGQFIWNSAKYLENEIEEELPNNDVDVNLLTDDKSNKNNFLVDVTTKAKDGENYFYCKVREGIIAVGSDVQIVRDNNSISEDRVISITKKEQELEEADNSHGLVKISIYNPHKIEKNDQLESI